MSRRLESWRTATALGIAGTYQPTDMDSREFPRLVYIVNADQAGTVEVWESTDPPNTVSPTFLKTASTAVVASTPQANDIVPRGNYLRIKYVNGGVAQGSFSFVGFVDYNDR